MVDHAFELRHSEFVEESVKQLRPHPLDSALPTHVQVKDVLATRDAVLRYISQKMSYHPA